MLPSTACPVTATCQVVAVRVVVDGVNVNDLQYLRTLPAEQVQHIDILTGRDATEVFGPSAAGGVIVVKTKSSRTERQYWR
jgi:outer membrane cobalamin receptor